MHPHPAPAFDFRRSRLPATLAAAMVAGFIISVDAVAQQIVKWTDESGHVHYSDHAPAGQTPVKDVAVSKAPTGVAPVAPVPHDALDPAYKARMLDGAGLAADHDAREAAAAADRERQRQKDEQQQAALAARHKADQAVIDRCKADHNLNCKNAQDIREREHWAAEMQCTNPAACRNVQQIWQNQQNSGN